MFSLNATGFPLHPTLIEKQHRRLQVGYGNTILPTGELTARSLLIELQPLPCYFDDVLDEGSRSRFRWSTEWSVLPNYIQSGSTDITPGWIAILVCPILHK